MSATAARPSGEVLDSLLYEMDLAVLAAGDLADDLLVALAEGALPAVRPEHLEASRRVIQARARLRSLAAGMSDPPSIEDFRAAQGLAKEVDAEVRAWDAGRADDPAADLVFASCRTRAVDGSDDVAKWAAYAAAVRVLTGSATPIEAAYVATLRARRAFKDAWSSARHEVPAVADTSEFDF